MDLIKIDKTNKTSRQLLNDHIPNRAFKNEYQTNDFTFMLHHMELIDSKTSENEKLLKCHISIRSNIVEPLELLSEDFLFSQNEDEPILCEPYQKGDTQLEEYFVIEPLKTIHGTLLYKVIGSIHKITVLYYEYYEDDNCKRYRLRYKL